MTDKRRTSAKWIIISMLVLLISYPLSVGPIAWLDVHDYVDTGTREKLSMIYAPLEFLYERFTPVESFFDWYLRLWVSR